MRTKGLTRRDFIRAAAATTIAGTFPFLLKSQETKGGITKSRVILIRDKNALDSSGQINAEVIQRMLDDAITTLLEEKNPVDAWKTMVNQSDIVGIKSNIWSYLPTGREVEQALKRRIMDAGVRGGNISISDRGVRRDGVFQKATALINVRPARTHHWSGMGSCIKNYITFVPSPPAYHADSCADLAKIWSLPQVKGKTKLNILLMLTPLFHGIGPHHFSRKYTWTYKGILVAQDPVAADATGVRILQAKRRQFFGQERPLQPPAKHIFLADTRHNLGNSHPDRIELVKMGWNEDILI